VAVATFNLFHNSTLGKVERLERRMNNNNNDDDKQLPILRINKDYSETLASTHEDKYKFLSCGESYKEPPDYSALFVPFTKLVWGLIFMTIFGWPTVLSLIENDFNLKNVLKDFDALFIGWAMILEQSHLRATNYKGRGPLYCYCGCVLLAILILSNAYKGDNIKTLTKSLEVVPLTHMSQVITAGYTTYSTQSCDKSDFNLYVENWGDSLCYAELHDKTDRRRNLTDEQIKLWTPSRFKSLIEDVFAKIDLYSLEKCQKTAYLGWRSVLEPMEKKLLQKQVKEKVHLGQEFLYS